MEGESFAKEFTRPVHLTPLATSGRIEPSPPYLSEAGDEADIVFDPAVRYVAGFD